jgi:hypothetical protein
LLSALAEPSNADIQHCKETFSTTKRGNPFKGVPLFAVYAVYDVYRLSLF